MHIIPSTPLSSKCQIVTVWAQDIAQDPKNPTTVANGWYDGIGLHLGFFKQVCRISNLCLCFLLAEVLFEL